MTYKTMVGLVGLLVVETAKPFKDDAVEPIAEPIAQLDAEHNELDLPSAATITSSATSPYSSRRNKKEARTCPLCGGKWRPDKPANGERLEACSTRNDRDLAHCIKYAWLLRELDADDLARPYVTSGPYCPWPQTPQVDANAGKLGEVSAAPGPSCSRGHPLAHGADLTGTGRMTDLTQLGRFGVIYADPPWSYRDLGHTRRIDRQYPILSVRDIAALPVQDIALPDAVLFLWIPVPLLRDGLSVMGAWGFDYKSNLVWDKEIFGMGHYARIQHEHLLLGTTGKPGTSADHGISSVIRERRGKHSVKPPEFYRLIERMYPALPRIELFARNLQSGWVSWGNDPALINSADGTIHQSA